MTDSLPRRQEEPHRKRVRLSPPLSIQSGSDGLDSSASEIDRSARGDDVDDCEEEDSSEDEEELRVEILDDKTFGDGEDSTSDSQINPANLLNDSPDRFEISRVKAKQIPPQIREKKLPDSFSALGISPQLQSALITMSIRTPTEVQAACILPLLAGKYGCPS